MIEINLLPSKKLTLPDNKTLVYIIFAIVGFLILLHLLLGLWVVIRQYQLKNLNNQWPQFKSDKEKIDALKKDLNSLESNVKTVEKLTTKRIIWSKKLETISNLMPKGIWLTYLTISPDKFSLQGSAISKKGEEMALISKFLNDLKANTDFSKQIKNLEIGPLQRRLIKDWEVIDFVFAGNIKE